MQPRCSYCGKKGCPCFQEDWESEYWSLNEPEFDNDLKSISDQTSQ